MKTFNVSFAQAVRTAPPMRIVSSMDELLELPKDPQVNGWGRRVPLRLEIRELSRHQQIAMQERFNRLQSRCGCVAGAVAMSLALIAGGYLVIERNAGSISWSWITETLAVTVAAFTIGFISKMSTLALTRWQFGRECRSQYRKFNPRVEGHV